MNFERKCSLGVDFVFRDDSLSSSHVFTHSVRFFQYILQTLLWTDLYLYYLHIFSTNY